MVRLEFQIAPALPVQSLTLGAVTAIVPSRPNVVTDNPVESGVRTTDHSRAKNATLQISAWLADDLRLESGTQQFRNAGATPVVLETGAATLEFLRRLQTQVIPVSVTSSTYSAPSMLITSVSAPRTADAGLGYRLVLDLVEFQTVKTSTAVVPRLRVAQVRKDIGPVTTTKTDAATEAKVKRKSVLAGSLDLIRKAF